MLHRKRRTQGRGRHAAREAAGIGAIRREDLRDTFASQVLTCGIQIGYVSKRLGHADMGVAVRHYAKWCGEDDYRASQPLETGECLLDLLARLPESHHSPTSRAWVDFQESATDG